MPDTTASKPVISFVIPVYREADALSIALDQVVEAANALGEPYELIVVDDGSPDHTWAVVRKQTDQRPWLRAVRLSRNFGKEAAIAAGISVARGQAVIVMDADLQHPPSLFSALVREWRLGADVVDAVKTYPAHAGGARRFRSWLFYTLLSRLSEYDLAGASDFKLLDRRVVDAWLTLEERSLFFRGMAAWLGFKHARVPFVVPERMAGETQWTFFHLIKLALTAVTAFSSLPLHLITVIGGTFSVFAIVLAAQTLWMKLRGEAVTGFATVILLLLIIGSALMIGLGIIGEYLSRIYTEVKRRPRYVVAERLEPPDASG